MQTKLFVNIFIDPNTLNIKKIKYKKKHYIIFGSTQLFYNILLIYKFVFNKQIGRFSRFYSNSQKQTLSEL